MRRLVELCGELGGSYLVHGSPAQRNAAAARRTDRPRRRAARRPGPKLAPEARRAGVTYCIEPLAPRETDFVNTIAEAAAIVERIGNAGAAHDARHRSAGCDGSRAGGRAHRSMDADRPHRPVQLNDRNRRGPGQGDDRFAPILAALKRNGYDGWLAMEPFDYVPDGPACAARSIGYVAGILEALE